jgi:hypothetical protein
VHRDIEDGSRAFVLQNIAALAVTCSQNITHDCYMLTLKWWHKSLCVGLTINLRIVFTCILKTKEYVNAIYSQTMYIKQTPKQMTASFSYLYDV